MINGFLIGVIVTASITAGAFFLKFWRKTRDRLFLAFGASFILEGLNRMTTLWWQQPTEQGGGVLFYLVRIFAFLLIVAAIIDKNTKSR